MLDEIKRIFTEGVVLPHFLNVYQSERSIEFTYILEAMSFLSQLVHASTDLTEKAQFEYIVQTVGTHLENYLRYNRREKNTLDIMLHPSKKDNSPTKHMEVISLSVLIALRQKNSQLCMMSILELPDSQIGYIR